MRYQALSAARFSLADWPQLMRGEAAGPDLEMRRQACGWLLRKRGFKRGGSRANREATGDRTGKLAE